MGEFANPALGAYPLGDVFEGDDCPAVARSRAGFHALELQGKPGHRAFAQMQADDEIVLPRIRAGALFQRPGVHRQRRTVFRDGVFEHRVQPGTDKAALRQPEDARGARVGGPDAKSIVDQQHAFQQAIDQGALLAFALQDLGVGATQGAQRNPAQREEDDAAEQRAQCQDQQRLLQRFPQRCADHQRSGRLAEIEEGSFDRRGGPIQRRRQIEYQAALQVEDARFVLRIAN
ncbi:MAG: hypothetical protein MZW92_07935 [Comamonadaceae bacterium]|nr:hypothetical protein [Comamonadaceae bacterium]